MIARVEAFALKCDVCGLQSVVCIAESGDSSLDYSRLTNVHHAHWDVRMAAHRCPDCKHAQRYPAPGRLEWWAAGALGAHAYRDTSRPAFCGFQAGGGRFVPIGALPIANPLRRDCCTACVRIVEQLAELAPESPPPTNADLEAGVEGVPC